MEAPLVSIVTPFHNTSPYLAECIESVLRQSYPNWEFVLVDNASSDGSTEIAQRCGGTDSRVRFVRCDELVPQVPNYNRALRLISPESRFVKVVEADNWIFPDCVAAMVALAQERPEVGIVGAYNATETRLRFTGLPLAQRFLSGRDVARLSFVGDAYLFGSPTTVLMRADLVRARPAFYDESLSIAEDLSACWDSLRESDFGFVHQILTFVRTENESILTRIKDFDAQAIDRLVLLRRHGRDLLAPDEFEAAHARVLALYYATLARGVLARQGAAFWRFHREGLAAAGLVLDRWRLAAAVARELASRAANPGSTVGAWRRSRRS